MTYKLIYKESRFSLLRRRLLTIFHGYWNDRFMVVLFSGEETVEAESYKEAQEKSSVVVTSQLLDVRIDMLREGLMFVLTPLMWDVNICVRSYNS